MVSHFHTGDKMKDCAFQYATKYKILIDTDLITRDEADILWGENIADFKRRVERDEDPEMALWINMENPTNYHTTAKHWIGAAMTLEDGVLFEKIRIG
jgi:hypothetical protein